MKAHTPWRPKEVVLERDFVELLIKRGWKPQEIRGRCQAVNIEIGWVLATRGGLR